ncbi:hypothetical protein QYE76_043674 [Lolium multiflorum]|uniref:Reverse transcriptase domain-containing protein n=1 Tax=Lolium multiflorum TaxID=4521 RepID=A0AAD8TJL8_LOLMU|nr:hypothetical protein QYE76_043674 [Lolium multiflorum]
MPGIPRELAEHALNVDPKAKLVQQTLRRFSEPKIKAIGEEVNRLRKAGFIRELKEAKWVANPVMVPKKDTTALCMCIDYTSLNKHCPKDHFPLPRIDQIVDSTTGCDRLSFLDAYSRYNQIKLNKEDQELTAFITPHGVYFSLIDNLWETFDNLDRNPSNEIFSELDEINARSYFCTKLPEDRRGKEVGQRGAATTGRRGLGLGRAALSCGALVWPPDLPFRLQIASVAKPQREPRYGKPSETPPPRIPSRDSEIASGTLPERGFISGGLFIAMIASGVMSE